MGLKLIPFALSLCLHIVVSSSSILFSFLPFAFMCESRDLPGEGIGGRLLVLLLRERVHRTLLLLRLLLLPVG